MFHAFQFEAENQVIYTSNDEIISYDLKRQLRKIVEECEPGAKIVVLYGIHGAKDGRLAHHDNDLVRCFKMAIEHVEKLEEKSIHEKKISIEHVILDTSSIEGWFGWVEILLFHFLQHFYYVNSFLINVEFFFFCVEILFFSF